VNQLKVLVHHAYFKQGRVVGVPDPRRFPLNPDAAAVRFIEAKGDTLPPAGTLCRVVPRRLGGKGLGSQKTGKKNRQ
jgi:hypothetical protein